MRILHCLSTREFAGTERHVAELVNQQALEHDVTILLDRHTIDIRTGDDICRYIGPNVRIVHAGRLGYAATFFWLTRRRTFDVIHTHLGRASFRARWLAPRRTPLVATLHNCFVPRVYAAHDGLICVAKWQLDALPPSSAENAAVIGNWTCCAKPDPDRRVRLRKEFGIDDQTFLIGAAGRLVPEKCFDLLIEAFKIANLPHTKLIIFGDGPEADNLRNRAAANVVFGGYRPDLKQDMVAFDGFVLPSRREPFGIVLLEAMATGLPVCATAAGGVLDLLAAHNECLVKPNDRDGLAEGLKRLRSRQIVAWNMEPYDVAQKALGIMSFYRETILKCNKKTSNCDESTTESKNRV
ncbi:lipopolysaccharide core biosynthesis glycosyl transferase [Neoasaia chiangmaiensis NBRC 101099]|uniref:glycosyltransferase n=1 Tax=Neoasaia chiangmaiensis TaxID=320497 RepID=UPI00098A1EF6|nr:glycosyltransferase [Neoasaia chiangmaiensis]GBR40548.1 lipopolysaccharide core biosynthesis glycosyl transferase [Neoasaia chiangmaiensis NBRC 101099]GEN13847.1 glycosyl transferase [Neoasaia chiangmaiensis]